LNDVAAVAHRLVAALVIVIVSGLPVAGVLCARECVAPQAAAASESDTHCHQDEPADTTRMSSTESTGCAPLVLIDAGTIERAGGQLTGASSATFSPYARAPIVSCVSTRGRFTAISVIDAGPPPGARLPLRI
jgi:hypothetical protein